MTSSGCVLIVDDEETIRVTVSAALRRAGFETQTAADAVQAMELLSQHSFDLALLDLKLPGAMDGVALLSEIRSRSPETQVIMISAHATLESAIAALRLGAFDYLLKPFTMFQLVEIAERAMAKRREIVRAVSGETGEGAEPMPRIRVDRLQRTVFHEGKPVLLSATEFDILVFLIDHSDRVVSASELMRAVQGYEIDERDARTIVRVHVQRIRQKLGDDPENPRYIQNVRGKGYRFNG